MQLSKSNLSNDGCLNKNIYIYQDNNNNKLTDIITKKIKKPIWRNFFYKRNDIVYQMLRGIERRWTLIFSLCFFEFKSEIIVDCDVGIAYDICDFISIRALRKNKEVEHLCVSLYVMLNHNHYSVMIKIEGREKKRKKEKQRRRESERKNRTKEKRAAVALRTV